jgi:hypothetical protein
MMINSLPLPFFGAPSTTSAAGLPLSLAIAIPRLRFAPAPAKLDFQALDELINRNNIKNKWFRLIIYVL